MKRNFVYGKYFYGNEVSEYGQKYGYVDYRTLAKAFDAVLACGIIRATQDIGEWELENGSDLYYENNDGDTLTPEEYDELDPEEQENYWEHYSEIYQYYIISDSGAEILKDFTEEIVFYNDELGLYVWGVTHFGTAWDYVLTGIRCNVKEN